MVGKSGTSCTELTVETGSGNVMKTDGGTRLKILPVIKMLLIHL